MIEVGLQTVRQLAIKANLSQSVVAQWLGGKAVKPETLKGIADALELSTEELQRLLEPGSHKAVG